MTLVNRYIARKVLSGIVMAFIIVTAIIMLVDFVEATRNIGEDSGLSMLTILGLTVLKTPQLIEQTIPFVVLFGVMGALYGLNKRSELIVLRASGLSAWRFLMPALWVSAVLGVLWMLAFNPLAAQSMEQYRDILAAYSQEDRPNLDGRDVWLREGSETGQTVIHGVQTDPAKAELRDVTFYYYDFEPTANPETDPAETIITPSPDTKQTSFDRRIDAARATLLPSGYWQLQDIVENADGEPFRKDVFASFPTQITVADLDDSQRSDRRPPFWTLPAEIARTEAAGFSSVRLKMQWHRLLSLPLMLIAMTIIAAGVSMTLTRSGGTLRLMLSGAAVGFGVYFMDNVISAFGEAGSLPVILAAWAVPVFVLFCATAYLSRAEDG